MTYFNISIIYLPLICILLIVLNYIGEGKFKIKIKIKIYNIDVFIFTRPFGKY